MLYDKILCISNTSRNSTGSETETLAKTTRFQRYFTAEKTRKQTNDNQAAST